MQVGDPKKAGVLAIVAILILFVAAFQLVPKAKKSAAAMVASSEAPPAPPDVKNNKKLPTMITADPFSRPRAAVGSTKPGEEPAQKSPEKSAKPDKGDKIPGGYRPFPGPIPGDLQAVGTDGKPVEIAGNDQQPKKEKRLSATLGAVLTVSRRIAVLSISTEEEPLRCEVGTMVKGYEVIELTESQITLRKGKNKLTITVGSTVYL